MAAKPRARVMAARIFAGARTRWLIAQYAMHALGAGHACRFNFKRKTCWLRLAAVSVSGAASNSAN